METSRPSSFCSDVTPLSVNPQGLIRENAERSVLTLSARPCIVTPWLTFTPIAQIFLAVGFETTAPTAAATVLAAKQQGIVNLYMLSAQKLVPPALRALLDDPDVRVDGFILPGHVSVITGTEVFQFHTEEYPLPGVVTGFEPLQILR